MANETVDNTWYIAIEEFSGKYCSFIGAGGRSYHGFRELASRGGINIVAENFDVTGHDIDKVADERVACLVKALNRGRKFDIQKALDQACIV